MCATDRSQNIWSVLGDYWEPENIWAQIEADTAGRESSVCFKSLRPVSCISHD